MIKDEKIKISIVIPVYNCERYLDNCLNSIINQTYTDFEVIVVDDGSTDKSCEIYKCYEEKDQRIKIIKQKNSGVSKARNKGIDNAKGKYLFFIDADDIIKSNMLEVMYNSIVKNDGDIAFSGFKVKGNNLRHNDTIALKELCDGKDVGVVTNEEVIVKTISTTPGEVLYGYIWRNLYRMDIIKENNIRFLDGVKISEDFMFILEVLDKCKNVIIVQQELYIYNINDLSVTAKYIDTLHEDMNFINEWMFNNICNKYKSVLDGYYCCIANTYLGFIQNICRKGTPYSILERIRLAYKVKKEYKYKIVLNKLWKQKNKFRKKAWIGISLFNFNLDLIYIILFSLKEIKNG